MKIQQLDEVEGRRTFVMVCDRGDDPVEALTAAAKRFDLSGASLTGIGAFSGGDPRLLRPGAARLCPPGHP
jgi:predicted DNA-binding protein with PD1-like motif